MEQITNDDRHALAIDQKSIYVECKCNNWKKCGNGYGFHIHGNNSNTNNREEGRSGHCQISYNNIIIDNDTFRGTLKKRIKTGWRKGTYIFEKK
jgi:hypothetical protein|tara:strand:- start:304 stop:585 length:282 start_codon:yes stop_codon:yes gene_type:complete